jgi:uncharacterized repeat protein (TIGR01451 family)
MKKTIVRSMSGVAALALALSITVATPAKSEAANAGTAANAQIINTVSVKYKDLALTDQPAVTATTTVTVLLVKSAANLSVASGSQTIAPNQTAPYTYTVTATANGPDTYTVNQGTITYSAASGVSATAALPAAIPLGATSVSAGAAVGATAITVPGDGVSGASVNGIGANSFIVIGGVEYQVASVTNTGGLTATITLKATTPLTAAISLGDSVYERKTFPITVNPVAVTVTTNPVITVPIYVTNTASTDSNIVSTATTISVPNLTITKEVSNDGIAWAATASAIPTGTLYYRITVTNAGTTTANSVIVTDPLTIYTTYTAGSGRLLTNAGQAYPAGGTALTDADTGIGEDGYLYNPVAGPTFGITYNAGAMPAGAVASIFFKVTVN